LLHGDPDGDRPAGGGAGEAAARKGCEDSPGQSGEARRAVPLPLRKRDHHRRRVYDHSQSVTKEPGSMEKKRLWGYLLGAAVLVLVIKYSDHILHGGR